VRAEEEGKKNSSGNIHNRERRTNERFFPWLPFFSLVLFWLCGTTSGVNIAPNYFFFGVFVVFKFAATTATTTG
jgi:hypothetical protein